MRAPLLNQFELFGAPEEKSYGGVNSVELPYWEENGKITSVALSDKLIVPVTYQKGGHIYAYVPGWGRQEKRGKNVKINFLSAMALIRHSMELTESIAGHNQSIAGHSQSIERDVEELRELLRAAEAKSLELEAENTRLLAELELLRAGKRKSRKLERENARLAFTLESALGTIARLNSRRWVNNRAVEWALDQELPTGGMKAVLVTFASHCDEHRESWPSVELIAETWKMARETVRT